MKNIFHKERFSQITIILACLIILILPFSFAYSNAQTSCLADKPPLTVPAAPTTRAWPQFTNVSIVVFDRSANEPTSTEEFNVITASIRDWNTVKISGCSNVTFGNATFAGRPWDGSEAPPDNTIYVVRTTDRNGQWKPLIRTFGVRAGWIYMNSNFNLQTTNFIVELIIWQSMRLGIHLA